MAQITRFRIEGLHGRQTVDIQIWQNRVVLVGVNGLGKTTIINLLYYFLTKQWIKLLEYRFRELLIVIDDQEYRLPRAIVESQQFVNRLTRNYPELRPVLERHPELWSILSSAPRDSEALSQLAEVVGVPLYSLIQLQSLMSESSTRPQELVSGRQLKEFDKRFQSDRIGQVLYLPTYRRIERDFEQLFPRLEDEAKRRYLHRANRPEQSLEFVEFGMRDVEKRFAEVLLKLKEVARGSMNGLAASYLAEVIRGEADQYDLTQIVGLSEETINATLKRVESANLIGESEQNSLLRVIDQIKSNTRIDEKDKYIAHFFSKLAVVHTELMESESSIASMVRICNEYLSGKCLVFDDREYTLRVLQLVDGSPLELRALSSGEKQIVSLFTHLYLGGSSAFVVLIDEPELSLSVTWQKRLLIDILHSKRCSFLMAVTHSPFVFENELFANTLDLSLCVSSQ